jgi:hypothetical protein
MNDVKSLLIATTVLAIGGLGLYMYKSEDSAVDFDLNDENSETASESGSEEESELDFDSDLEELDYDDYKPKEKNKGTRKNNKKNSGTRKKH